MRAGAFRVAPEAFEEGPRAVGEMKNVATGCSDIFTLAGSKTARFRAKMGVLYICKKVPCLTKVPTRLPTTTKVIPRHVVHRHFRRPQVTAEARQWPRSSSPL